jgi:hypothetical protein
MSEPRSPHDNLLYFGILSAVGVMIIIASLSNFLGGGWESALIGAILTGVGGFEVKVNFTKIQYENNVLTASQSGVGNNQVIVTNPHSSPTIGKVEHYYAVAPAAVNRIEISESEPATIDLGKKSRKMATRAQVQTAPPPTQWQGDLEEVYHGDSHFEEFQDFEVSVKKGDRINFNMRAAHPISVHIVPSESIDDVGGENIEEISIWNSAKGKNVSFSWLAKKNQSVYVVIANETDLDEWEEGEAEVDVKINAVRTSRA